MKFGVTKYDFITSIGLSARTYNAGTLVLIKQDHLIPLESLSDKIPFSIPVNNWENHVTFVKLDRLTCLIFNVSDNIMNC